MWATRLLGILLSMMCLGAAQETTTYITHYLEPFPGPQVYKDLSLPKTSSAYDHRLPE
jgi:hypothetical protein